MKQTGNTILITGGGSGIGAALAQSWHDAGNTVIVSGRRLEALEETVAGRENLHAVQLDVEDPAAIATFAKDLITRFPKLNVLFNNAGIMKFEDLTVPRDLADAEATIITNVLGPIRVTNALIGHLAAQPDATIINTTSGLGFVPMIDAATYSASKAALHSYTLSLRATLKGKVEVIELVPPAVQTTLTPGQENREGYQPLAKFVDEVLALFAQEPTPPEITVEGVKFLRNAEAEGRAEDALVKINDFARKARESA